MTIMVTGGAGYIGSHTCVELISKGYSIVIVDNFCNSQPEVLNRIERIAGVSPAVVQGDVRDRDLLKNTMIKYHCNAVIHFAGLKSVADSVNRPLEYYDNNVLGSLRLIQAMQETPCSQPGVFFIGNRIRRADYSSDQGGSSAVAV
jgi:UDP-glucose 4-epimerase